MVNATNFDGSTDYLLRAGTLTGVVDGQVGIFSCWAKPGSSSTTTRLLASLLGRIFTNLSSNRLDFLYRNTAGTTTLAFTVNTALTADVWSHLLVSWDTSASLLLNIYVNDSAPAFTTHTQIAGTLDYTEAQWAIGAGQPGNFKYGGCLSEFYWNPAEYLDFTQSANRRKFITSDLGPADLGADGSTPTGTAPAIYLPNAFSAFGTNAGTGGDFIDQGSVAACADTPAGTPSVPTGDYILPLMRRRQRRA